ncbi:tRNA adenosine(34) deaminase TadA [Calderihabitans maritimus]|uniref:tRNA-specific adenosine deaminase n=1 Tax=Calderihabitans maritimus TaxID=1246530 RepID=A0A1Z5HWE0_9FIRM|nr:tRNA adenosine(34) deaminase TadA [Calderihabitans maritimus]GAW93635.1 hypothetical protein KKC1_27630 [Calderihabitans maritimus]
MKHREYMQQALVEAEKAFAKDEVPIGAVITYGDKIIARAHNLKESKKNPVAHAEILAIQEAAAAIGSWRLTGCSLYVTLEPCPMCTGAMVQARISRLIYGAADPKAGAVDSVINLANHPRLNHQIEVIAGVMEEESRDILKRFFAKLR